MRRGGLFYNLQMLLDVTFLAFGLLEASVLLNQ